MPANLALWLGWLALTVALVLALAYALLGGKRELFLIGQTTSGHHQIELACDACHTSPFGGREVLQEACVGCHGAELQAARDTHPKSKFTDPRNADRVKQLDARFCVTCHREHRAEITRAMGVTMPNDYCALCHQAIGEERPSHVGLAFNTCASAGCHNFHDNRGLYEEFLAEHLDDPRHKPNAVVAWRGPVVPGPKALNAAAHNAPPAAATAAVMHEWAATSHAAAGVNCGDCHVDKATRAWVEAPGLDSCRTCHAAEADGFLAGKHGMRLARGMPPMTPATARLPMKSEAHATPLVCTTCHAAHRFDTSYAAVDACESCHADDHTRAYRDSPHFRLWQAERAGEAAPGSGVSCATCHMPRHAAGGAIKVQHNQNDNLRPNEKMLRSVCLDCHGLGFSIDALADPAAVAANFSLRPGLHIESLDFVRRRQAARRRQTESRP